MVKSDLVSPQLIMIMFPSTRMESINCKLLNGKPNFGYQFDTYSFDDMRYINALVDYQDIEKHKRVQIIYD
jgi:hypothetical protein